MLNNVTLNYSHFQFIILLSELFGSQLKNLDVDQQHTIATKLYLAWDNHDEVFRDHYAYPMSDSESMQQWFEENKPKIESLMIKALENF